MLGRLWLVRSYRCRECRQPYKIYRPWFSLRARCPGCGNADLKAMRKIDPIEGLSRNPASLIQGFLRAPLLYCRWCRLQFYDFRPVVPRADSGAGSEDLAGQSRSGR
jgi:hypothetical protein